MKKILISLIIAAPLYICGQSAFDEGGSEFKGFEGDLIENSAGKEIVIQEKEEIITPQEDNSANTQSQNGKTLTESEIEEQAAIQVSQPDLSEKLPEYLNNIFDGRNVKAEELLGGDDPEIKGYISNLQQAPFNENIISFEASVPENESVRLFLYNMESEFLAQISPVEDYEQNIRMIPFPVKDRGVNWHPSKNAFVFYSNGYENREQLFIVEIIDEYFIEEEPVSITRIEFKEPKKTVNHCLYADFNSTGEDLYFTVRIEKENIKEKYNKYYNIAVAENIFKYESDGFSDVKYEVLFNRKFDQIKPVCSSVDPDQIAFLSFSDEFKENYGYAKYSLVVYNRKTGKSSLIDKLTGYRDYPYQWGPSGIRLYYCAALPIQKTPNSFREKRMNIINLQVAELKFGDDGSIRSRIVENSSSPYIMGDVATKDQGISFVSDDLLLMAKYDPYESIFLVDMEKWSKNDGFYIKQLPIPDDTDFPVLGKKSFIFLKYQYFNMPDNSIRTVSTVNAIPYEPEVDEEAQRKKAERRAKKKAERREAQDGE